MNTTINERPISVTTGAPSQRGKRLRSTDGLTWKQRNAEAVNVRRRSLYAENPKLHRERQRTYKAGVDKPKVLAAIESGRRSTAPRCARK